MQPARVPSWHSPAHACAAYHPLLVTWCTGVWPSRAHRSHHVRDTTRDCHNARAYGVIHALVAGCPPVARALPVGQAGLCGARHRILGSPHHPTLPQPRHVRCPPPHPGRSSLGLRSSARAFQPISKQFASSSCAESSCVVSLKTSAISHTPLVHSLRRGLLADHQRSINELGADTADDEHCSEHAC